MKTCPNNPRLFRVTLSTRRFLITAPDGELAHAWAAQRFGSSVADLRELTDEEFDLLALDFLRLAFAATTAPPAFTVVFQTDSYTLKGYGRTPEEAVTDLLARMLARVADVDARVFGGLTACLEGVPHHREVRYQCDDFTMVMERGAL